MTRREMGRLIRSNLACNIWDEQLAKYNEVSILYSV
jgi:hypothetical protein